MTTETYEIFALKYGCQTNRTRYYNFMADDDHASPGPIDYFVWVIRNDNRTIVVDTGFDHKEAANRGLHLIRIRLQHFPEILEEHDPHAPVEQLVVTQQLVGDRHPRRLALPLH